MSRKDYIALAATIRWALEEDDADANAARILRNLAEYQASIMQGDNPHFDRVRFMDACGFGDES